MLLKNPFDLGRVDVVSTRENHVLETVDHIEVSIGVHAGDVSGVEPSVRLDGLPGRLRFAVVSHHHDGPADEEFSGLIRAQRLCRISGIGDPGFAARQGDADRSVAVFAVEGMGGPKARDLGHAPKFD